METNVVKPPMNNELMSDANILKYDKSNYENKNNPFEIITINNTNFQTVTIDYFESIPQF